MSCGMSLAKKYAHCFMLSIEQGPQAMELEVSGAMVCTAATAVRDFATSVNWTDQLYRFILLWTIGLRAITRSLSSMQTIMKTYIKAMKTFLQ